MTLTTISRKPDEFKVALGLFICLFLDSLEGIRQDFVARLERQELILQIAASGSW